MAGPKKYYIVNYLPDGKGAPYFFQKKFDPDLPDYDVFNRPPNPDDFSAEYKLRALVDRISVDYLPDDNIASLEAVMAFERLGVSFFARPIDIMLSKKTQPKKQYFVFFLQDYLSILNRQKSIYIEGLDFSKSEENLSSQHSFPKRYFYDKIDRFVVDVAFDRDLFWCLEISRPVASERFKLYFEENNLSGVGFIPLDDNYKFDPWA